MKIFPNIKNLAALLLVSVCAFGVRLDLVAMPTAEELAEVKPLVAELIKPDMDAMRAGKKSKSDAAKASMALVSQAETPAAKLLLTRNAFQLYMKGGDYDAADAALAAMLKAVPDYPADELQELLEKALYPVPSKKAPQIRARVAALKQKAAAATQLKKVLALLEKTPDDPALNLRLGTVCALQNDWKRAAQAFAKGSDAALAKAAKAELDLEISPAKAADLYWSVELPKKDAQLQSSLRAHAADLYKLSLPDLTGLTKVQAERRIKEVEQVAVEESVPVIAASGSRKNPYVTKGLVAMWDGEWNVAFGRHDEKTKVWKDLIGKNDCIPNGTPSFSRNSSLFDGQFCWQMNISPDFQKILNSDNFSVEVVLRFSDKATFDNEGVVGIGPSGSRSLWCFAGAAPMSGNATLNFQVKGGKVVRTWKNQGKLVGVQTLSLTSTTAGLQSYVSAKASGEGAPGATPVQTLGYLGCIEGYARMQGEIFSVRVYERALDARELLQNYTIDRHRFGSGQ